MRRALVIPMAYAVATLLGACAARKGSAAFDRGTLEAYLGQRHADGDRLTFVSLTMSGSRDPNVGNFGFVVRRGQIDLVSKGALDCRSGKFVVWSLGRTRDRRAHPDYVMSPRPRN